MSRTTKVVGSALAVALVAGGAWAAGTALHSSPSTVNFRAAAADGGGSTGNAAPNASPRPHPGGGMGGGGTVASVDQAGSSFTVTGPTRPKGAAPAAPGGAAPATPSSPTTTTKTIKVTGSTTYYVTEPGTASDIATGMRIGAFGTVANGEITASAVTLVQAGIGKAPNKPAPATAPATPPKPDPSANPNPNANPNVANRPFVLGTVKSVTPGSGGSVTVVVTAPRGGDRTVVVNASTTVTKTVKGSFSDVRVGAIALARGTRNSDGSVTASVVEVVASGVKRGPGPGFGPAFGPGAVPGFGPGFGHRFGPRGGGGPGPGFRGGPGYPGPAGTTNGAPAV
ncbi:MAG TPA: hypothetical protein VFA84_05920 [Acidimicrobiales bacterium]|nr:hypothetical protein [Acidimicrobiales bacterium]